MTAYATVDDVKPLIGNLANQRTTLAIDNAIEGASQEVNLSLGREADVNLDSTSNVFGICKKITRYLAAAELLGGIQSQETTMQSYMDTAQKLLNKLVQDEQEEDIGASYVESSAYTTWPGDPINGEIYSSTYQNLRKGPRVIFQNQYTSDFYTPI